MNNQILLDILELAVSLAALQLKGESRLNLDLAQTLLAIIQKGADAYRQHTGEPLDSSLIKTEDTI